MGPPDNDPIKQARYEMFMDYVSKALDAGQTRMDGMETNIAANTAATNKNTLATEAHQAQTKEMIDVFNSLKGGFKVLEWIGTIGKIIGGIAAGIGAIYGGYLAIMKYFK
jgi:hypothetical protein